MEEKIRIIVGEYLGIAPTQLTVATVVDRSTLKNSIVVHRLYASLAQAGISIQDYQSIRTFGEILSRAGEPVEQVVITPEAAAAPGVGVDIEQITNLPEANDFRSDSFYQLNFSPREISYCLCQPNPRASFAGLFAAKESIAKADGAYRNRPFHHVEISHDESGKPFFPGFQLSITHTDTLACAVAVSEQKGSDDQVWKRKIDQLETQHRALVASTSRIHRLYQVLLIAAIVVAIIAFFRS